MNTIARAVLAAAMWSALTATASAEPPPADPAIDLPLDTGVDAPRLVEMPNGDDLRRNYPPLALGLDIPGSASMNCRAQSNGRLDDCRLVSESPAGLGFGAATLRSASYFRVRPALKDGRAVEGRITIPMRWVHGLSYSPPQPPALPAVAPADLALGRQIVEAENVSGEISDGWKPEIEQQRALLLAGGSDPLAVQAVMDAFQLGVQDAAGAAAERQAHDLALRLSDDDLRATVTFLAGPAGRAWMAERAHAHAEAVKALAQHVFVAGRLRVCARITCGAASTPAAAKR